MQHYSIVTDAYDDKTKGFIEPGTLKTLSKVRPWRGIVQVALEWLGIAVAIIVCSTYWNPFLYIAAVAWIGARQNGLAVMMHEAVHYRLLPSRKWNEWAGEIFTAWPLLITVNGFRQTHFAHHRHVNTPADPDWQRKQNGLFTYPKTAGEIVVTTLKYWLGFYAFMEFFGVNREAEIPDRLQWLRLSFFAAIIVASVLLHFWAGLLMYWIVPLFTYFLWIIYVRGVAEHFAGIEDNKELIEKTRHIEANLFERLMFAPNYIHAHIAHHLYPSVPFYNLKALQELLMQNPDYAGKAHITKGYIAFLKECLGPVSRPAA